MRVQPILCWALLAASACNGDDLSIGELRCVATHCGQLDDSSVQETEGVHPEQLVEAPATLLWQTSLGCADQADCESAFATRTPTWSVHPDGSITTARAYAARQDGDLPTPTKVVVSHFSPDGELLWQHDEPQSPSLQWVGNATFALAQAPDGAVILATSGVAPQHVLRVLRLDVADGQSQLLFERADGTLPVALAGADADLLIAGYSSWDEPRNPELSRYRLSGELVWRQAVLRDVRWQQGVLRDNGLRSTYAPPPDIQLASDVQGRSLVALSSFADYSFVQLDAGGMAHWWTFSWPQGIESVRTQVAFDGEGRAWFGSDSAEGYLLSRCASEDCSKTTTVWRTRDAYYSPVLMGLVIDAQARPYALTQDGVRGEQRILIDRYTADMSKRETFVVHSPDSRLSLDSEQDSTPSVVPIAIGPGGDVYYETSGTIGRIKLGSP